jgi:hypothetical protein
LETVKYITKKNLKNFVNEVEITPSKVAMDNVCSTKKICDAQGKITFGQLRELVESGTRKRILTHMGEGGYKATLRLLPWFIPQLALAGFAATWVRVVNKLLRPTLEETTNYRTWWGKTILKIFDLVEGELNASDPLSKIFFISDGLMTMLDDKYKIKFSNYIANIADEKLDNEIVPDYFVENELRHWLNKKFFLDPPLQPKKIKDDTEETSLTEEYKKKVILEKAQKASHIRKIVRDIITLYKREFNGEFYLPDELDDNKTEYILPNSQIDVELIIQPSDEVNDFMVNANFYRNDDVIVVKIVYNPNKKTQIIYDLIGELNEIISHELRHQFQRDTGMFEFNDEDEDDDDNDDELEGLEYYSQPHEIDSQVEGFKRMRDVTRRPFEELVRNWFRTHPEIHDMNPEDTKKVIDLILDYYRNS